MSSPRKPSIFEKPARKEEIDPKETEGLANPQISKGVYPKNLRGRSSITVSPPLNQGPPGGSPLGPTKKS